MDLKRLNLTIEESRDIINFITQKRGISTEKLLSTIKPNRKNNEILTTKTQQNMVKTQQNMAKTQQELIKSQKSQQELRKLQQELRKSQQELRKSQQELRKSQKTQQNLIKSQKKTKFNKITTKIT